MQKVKVNFEIPERNKDTGELVNNKYSGTIISFVNENAVIVVDDGSLKTVPIRHCKVIEGSLAL